MLQHHTYLNKIMTISTDDLVTSKPIAMSIYLHEEDHFVGHS